MDHTQEVGANAALSRIDSAISRIERAAAATRADRKALATRHERLRTEVTQTIAALDAVIERPQNRESE